jgi:4-hydroxy-3-polyprenylbenzoate decarboxylase
MVYRDLREFLAQLEQDGELQTCGMLPVSPHLEMTALCQRALHAGGPALLFEQPTGHSHAGAGQPVWQHPARGFGHAG